MVSIITNNPKLLQLLTQRINHSDGAVKQILIQLDLQNQFIISDLDDFHLLIKPEKLSLIQELLTLELEKNNYVVPE